MDFSGLKQLPELVRGLYDLYVTSTRKERAVKSFFLVPQSIKTEDCYAIRRTEAQQLEEGDNTLFSTYSLLHCPSNTPP